MTDSVGCVLPLDDPRFAMPAGPARNPLNSPLAPVRAMPANVKKQAQAKRQDRGSAPSILRQHAQGSSVSAHVTFSETGRPSLPLGHPAPLCGSWLACGGGLGSALRLREVPTGFVSRNPGGWETASARGSQPRPTYSPM